MVDIKVLRRIIIIICLVILIPEIIHSLPKDKYLDDNKIKRAIEKGEAEVIELNIKDKIDNDIFTAERLIIGKEESYLIYSLRKSEVGWSFPAPIQIYDEKNKNYQCTQGFSRGKLYLSINRRYGDEGVLRFDKIEKDVKMLILKLEWYDRKMEIEIPLKKVKSHEK
ncbi:hypothetical protein [Crassaminicella profunda]|uniref:hypothetical protein n=1 Tax=Crassaminicella profunda TaxID=1286698 RepID=UPI001CA739F4|nr:hypothetical protein [Crassaminicella profunda]QZY54165.1 hypothetical protein K7H06_14065 [Crassaminicella profunda]